MNNLPTVLAPLLLANERNQTGHTKGVKAGHQAGREQAPKLSPLSLTGRNEKQAFA
jgi:hypothetical protein